VVGQLFILNTVLSTRYSTFGIDMVKQLVSQHDWTEDSYVAFPRVTFCDFLIRGQDVGNVQQYTVQCVLPINLYNEKIYVFLWFWMIFVALFSAVSFFIWLSRTFLIGDRVKFIRNHLILGNRIQSGTDSGRLVRQFVIDYLRQDGVFIFRLIAHNTNNITTTEVICATWDMWKEKSSMSSKDNDNPSHGLYPDASDMDTLALKK
jgi:innexin